VTVFVWDISNHDHTRIDIDYASATEHGVDVAIHKVSEGMTYVDPYASVALPRMATTFAMVGAYHVLSPDSPIAAQAHNFIALLDWMLPGWMDRPTLIQLDCEHFPEFSRAPTPNEIYEWLGAFATYTKERITPVVYAPKWQYGDTLHGLITPLWASDYGNNPAIDFYAAWQATSPTRWAPYSGIDPSLLQYGSKVTIGSNAGCDISAFRGTMGDLARLTQGGIVGDHEMIANADANAWAVRMGIDAPVYAGDQPGTPVGAGNPLWDLLRGIETQAQGNGGTLDALTTTVRQISDAVSKLQTGATIDPAALLADPTFVPALAAGLRADVVDAVSGLNVRAEVVAALTDHPLKPAP
jgi:Glycosyl hydrolases family 25